MFNTKVRLFFIIIMLFSAILTNPAPAWGCSCVEARPPEEAFVQADAVFVARVTGEGNFLWDRLQIGVVQIYHKITRPLPHASTIGLYGRKISFDVQDSWKGVETTQITLRTGWEDSDCGTNFQQGKQYLVYAYQLQDGQFYAEICTRTAPLARAGEDIDYLQTVPKLELTYVLPMFNFGMLCLAIPLLSAMVLGVVIWRRRYTLSIRS